MSWLFSRALVEEYSAATCSDGVPSAPLSVMPTQHKFWRNDKTMEPCQLSRFGLTCAVLTDDLGTDLLTWYLADSRARTFPLLERVPELRAHAQACGNTWPESSARYDLDSYSWKTHRCLFSEDLPWSSVILPRWGTILNGYVYQHPTAERPIRGTESGLWQTPVADDAMNRKAGKWNSRGEPKLSAQVKHPEYWPTPRSCSAMAATITPESAWHENRFPNLETVVGRRMWPTPNATDANKWNNQSLADRKAKGQQIRLSTAVSPEGGACGQLNPAWVEWLMGWPLGWTDLKPLEMDKFHEWRRQHLA